MHGIQDRNNSGSRLEGQLQLQLLSFPLFFLFSIYMEMDDFVPLNYCYCSANMRASEHTPAPARR
jgi:hypothetical protein